MKLEAGDPALLIDSKGRRFLLELTPERTFQYHEGAVPHNDLIGRDDGSWILSSTGAQLLLLRPRLADFTLKMKRSAQVVYPKDLGPILVYAMSVMSRFLTSMPSSAAIFWSTAGMSFVPGTPLY